MKRLNILAIPGSLREESLTRKLLYALQPLAPDELTISVFGLHDIPLYNLDIENSIGFPPPVQELRDAIAAADGLILATPEYNGSMTGVLKNGIDWMSRQGLMAKKPATPITGSPGALGATKSQMHLRSVMGHLGMCVLSRPALAIPQLDQKMEGQTIVDEQTRKMVADWLESFRDWIVQLNK